MVNHSLEKGQSIQPDRIDSCEEGAALDMRQVFERIFIPYEQNDF